MRKKDLSIDTILTPVSFHWKVTLSQKYNFCNQATVLTLIRVAGGVYDFRNFEEV
jgi:hypothetical protein